MVRGMSVGISFTMISNIDFIYCTPKAQFFVPFMQSYQSPEGGSTVTFPEQFGTRLANEILMLDRPVPAAVAMKAGFVNDLVPEEAFPTDSDFFDPNVVPCIPKLLATDYTTLVNCKHQLNLSKNLRIRNDTVLRENKALAALYLKPGFVPKMASYMKQVAARSAKKKQAKL